MGFLAGTALLLLGACALVAVGAVKVKMLPYDNESEVQGVVDTDEGTTLERTLQVAQEIAASVRAEPEVLNYRIYAGTSAPYNFNGPLECPEHPPALLDAGPEHEVGRRVTHHLRGVPRSRAAFAVVPVLIYTLVVGWCRSFRTPFVIMAAIPFSLVRILPAHWALGAFLTATSMIGFMAGTGIVVLNSIILVDFIELRVKQGMPLPEAVVDVGAVRFRPMMLTAMAVVVGGSVILLDPIFQGLAISLMAGELASLLISRMAVPVIYELWMR
jgi:multidrug efflux pump subunit AcrB